jgi:hypothetical protein
MSLDTIARSVINILQANPNVQAKLQWDLSLPAMMNRVDEYNAAICVQQNWTDYVAAGGQPEPPPFLPNPSQSDQNALAAVAGKVKTIWAGVRTLNEWLDSGEPAVAAELSAKRASVCAACTKNTAGDFTSWFTKPASEAIRRQLERVQDRKLSTPNDATINVCDVCLCPLKLKVHTPFPYIRKHLTNAILNDLRQVPGCWIPAENNG